MDVPNATVMAHHYRGRRAVRRVSQLHQPPRPGRPGSAPGPCPPVTEAQPDTRPERLDAVAATLDGFAVPARPSSSAARATSSAPPSRTPPSLKLLQLLADEDLIGLARDEATTVVTADPQPAAHLALRAIDELLGVQAEYLDKT